MIQIPDMPPEYKAGLVGFLLFVILGLVTVIGFLIKNGWTGLVKQSGPPREPLSGEKPTEYWERIFKDIETEGNKALLAVLTDHHRAVMEMLGKLRARLRDSDQAATAKALQEFRARYDQDMISIAKMLRSFEEKLNEK